MSPSCLSLLLLLTLIGISIADDPSCPDDCTHGGPVPVCGAQWSNQITYEQFPNYCTLVKVACHQTFGVGKVPVAFGQCPPARTPLNCKYTCPNGFNFVQCGRNIEGTKRRFQSACDLVHHNCVTPSERYAPSAC